MLQVGVIGTRDLDSSTMQRMGSKIGLLQGYIPYRVRSVKLVRIPTV